MLDGRLRLVAKEDAEPPPPAFPQRRLWWPWMGGLAVCLMVWTVVYFAVRVLL